MQNKKTQKTQTRGVVKRILTTPVSFGDEMKNFAWWFEKVYTNTNKWMAGKNLKRQVYHGKMRFAAGLIWRVSMIKTMNMHNKFGIE